MKSVVTIADYGMGNLRSVSKAFEHIGQVISITNSPKDILDSSALVVPGVGAFGDCINNLKTLGLLDVIKKFITSGKPYLGICLGMQILFNSSEEAPGVRGLGIFSGTVKKFPENLGLKIPHMGWNTVHPVRGRPAKGTATTASGRSASNGVNNTYMYFVHSYYVDPADKSIIAGETEYGIRFCSMIKKDNIWATQFHPEKSQKLGLEFLQNFIKICR